MLTNILYKTSLKLNLLQQLRWPCFSIHVYFWRFSLFFILWTKEYQQNNKWFEVSRFPLLHSCRNSGILGLTRKNNIVRMDICSIDTIHYDLPYSLYHIQKLTGFLTRNWRKSRLKLEILSMLWQYSRINHSYIW